MCSFLENTNLFNLGYYRFRASVVLLAVVLIFVIAWISATLGIFEWIAVFLAGSSVLGKLSVLVHSKSVMQEKHSHFMTTNAQSKALFKNLVLPV